MNGTIRNIGEEGLFTILRCGLERYAEQRTVIQLGDRSRYIGLSDIAKMLNCPRAALAAKLYQLNTETLPKLSNSICSLNVGIGSKGVSIRLSSDMACLLWLS